MEYDSEFEDDEMQMLSDNSSGSVGVENAYYNTKAYKEDDPRRAISEFDAIVSDQHGSEWAIRAAKQTLKLKAKFMPSELEGAFLVVIAELEAAASLVSDSYIDKSFASIAQLVVSSGQAQAIFSSALATSPRNLKLELRLSMALAKCYVETGDFSAAAAALCVWESNEIPLTLELEYVALQIRLALARNDWEKVERWHGSTSPAAITGASDASALIREVGAIASLRRGMFERSTGLLLKSFKAYDELGRGSERKRALQLYCIASLAGDRNPFDLPEVRAYEQELETERAAVTAFFQHDASRFRHALEEVIIPEPAASVIPAAALLDRVRDEFDKKTLLWLVQPYSRMRMNGPRSLSERLGVDRSRLEYLVSQLILESKQQLGINEIDDTVEIVEQIPLQWVAPTSQIPLPARFGTELAARQQRQNENRILGAYPAADLPLLPAPVSSSEAHARLLLATRALHISLMS